MTDLKDLVRAAAEKSAENTPASMLVDHLIETGDGRGEIIRKWLNREGRTYNFHQAGSSTEHLDNLGNGTDLTSHAHVGWFVGTSMNGERHKVPVMSVHLYSDHPDDAVSHRGFAVRMSHPEARAIADRLPDAEEVHRFLDKHFGPDPRFNADLSNALKPKTE